MVMLRDVKLTLSVQVVIFIFFFLFFPFRVRASFEPPHNSSDIPITCVDCHLAVFTFNVPTLCQKCHNTGGYAETKIHSNSHMAEIGLTGKSHRWDSEGPKYVKMRVLNGTKGKVWVSGPYTGQSEFKQYDFKIETSGDSGVATFSWTDTDGGSGSAATGVDVSLNDGIKLTFDDYDTDPTTDDFVAGATGRVYVQWVTSPSNPVMSNFFMKKRVYDLYGDGVQRVVCTVCHNQHEHTKDSPYLRINNIGNAMCKVCHYDRNKSHYGVEHGYATGGSTTSLIDTNKNWALNQHQGKQVYFQKNFTTPRFRVTIDSNSTNTINWLVPVTDAIVSGDGYNIIDVLESGTATGGSASTLIDTSKNWTGIDYTGKLLYLSNYYGAFGGVYVPIGSNDATTLYDDTGTPIWGNYIGYGYPITVGEPYEIVEIVASGTATGGGTTSLTDTTQNWSLDQYQNKEISIRKFFSSNSGFYRTVASNTVDTLYWNSPVENDIINGDGYRIVDTSNIGMHPVGIIFSQQDTVERFFNPSNIIPLMLDDAGTPSNITDDTVECMTCHSPHYAYTRSTDGGQSTGEVGGEPLGTSLEDTSKQWSPGQFQSNGPFLKYEVRILNEWKAGTSNRNCNWRRKGEIGDNTATGLTNIRWDIPAIPVKLPNSQCSSLVPGSTALSDPITSGDIYEIVDVTVHQATGGSTSTLDDSAQQWTQDALVGSKVRILSGSNRGRERVITGNSATQLSWSILEPLSAISIGDRYEIVSSTFLRGGVLLDKEDNETLCMTCHKYQSHFGDNIVGHITTSPKGRRMNCRDCHVPHDPRNTNRFLLRPVINDRVVNASPGENYVNNDRTGICQVCHTQTDHWRNDGTEPIPHFTNGCPQCHNHADSTAAWKPKCNQCHGYPPVPDPATNPDITQADLANNPLWKIARNPNSGGAHLVHVIDAGFPCKYCHGHIGYGPTHNQTGCNDYDVPCVPIRSNISFNFDRSVQFPSGTKIYNKGTYDPTNITPADIANNPTDVVNNYDGVTDTDTLYDFNTGNPTVFRNTNDLSIPATCYVGCHNPIPKYLDFETPNLQNKITWTDTNTEWGNPTDYDGDRTTPDIPCRKCHDAQVTMFNKGVYNGVQYLSAHPVDTTMRGDCKVCHDLSEHHMVGGTGEVLLNDNDYKSGTCGTGDCNNCVVNSAGNCVYRTSYYVGYSPGFLDENTEPGGFASSFDPNILSRFDPSALLTSTLTGFCLSCHDEDGNQPFSGTNVPPNIRDLWDQGATHPNNATRNLGCFGPYATVNGCHGNPHASAKPTLHAKYTDTNPAKREEGFCYNCHGNDLARLTQAPNIQDQIDKIGDPLNSGDGSGHPLGFADLVHSRTEPIKLTDKHVECYDCHNPHADKGSTVALNASNRLEGRRYVDIDGVEVDAFPVAARQPYIYEVCFRCHGSDYATFFADALPFPDVVQSRDYGTSQDRHFSNKRKEFDPRSEQYANYPVGNLGVNTSYHPVVAPGRNATPALFEQLKDAFGLSSVADLETLTINCTDCHNNEVTASMRGPATYSALRSSDKSPSVVSGNNNFNTDNNETKRIGPHGSTNKRILRANYDTNVRYDATTIAKNLGYDNNRFALCFLCHEESVLTYTGSGSFYGTNFGGNTGSWWTGNLHAEHLSAPTHTGSSGGGAVCHECHQNVHSNVEAQNTIYGDGLGGMLPPDAEDGIVDGVSSTHLLNFGPQASGATANKPRWYYDGSRYRCNLYCHGANMQYCWYIHGDADSLSSWCGFEQNSW